jgi:ATP-dependent helicase HrpB
MLLTPLTQVIRDLPIGSHLESIAAGVRDNAISIIQSSPGSGKTTVLPLFLATQPWLSGQGILVLQPRRLAAKSVAARMAELLEEPLGGRVGYQIRLEQKRSSMTQIEVITEGLLTRRLVSDPELRGTGIIIFDEFHERNAHADIGLALAREVSTVLRADLRIIIMSATLNSLLDHPQFAEAWRYSFDTSPYPVEVRYVIPESRKPLWDELAKTIRSALLQHPGDLLAFLPGRFEIERCTQVLTNTLPNVDVLPLYGDLPYDQQQRALLPSAHGLRKIVLATPIAETSLTIPGIRIVVDSGLHKIGRSDSTGSTHLTSERITLDSADQRAGRAGRTAPGVCIRLWGESDHKTLRPAREPEILRSDITSHLLELFAWGVRDPLSFTWITSPPKHVITQATGTLRTLNAVSSDGAITERGRWMVQLGVHPRLAGLCLSARNYGIECYAAAIIALLEERLPVVRGHSQADITSWVASLLDARSRVPRHLRELYVLWLRRIESIRTPSKNEIWNYSSDDIVGYLLALAFPERIAQRRDGDSERYLLASGKGVALPTRDPLARFEYLVAATLQYRSDDGVITLAAPLNPILFDSLLAHYVTEHRSASFDETRGVLIAEATHQIGAIRLRQQRRSDLSPAELKEALTAFLRTVTGHSKLPFSDRFRSLQARAAWARTTKPGESLPDISDDILLGSNPFWLEPFLPSTGKLTDITPRVLEDALATIFSWNDTSLLQRLAPEFFQLPNGKSRAIDYSDADAPAVDVMIQELFGLRDTPTIGDTKQPLTLRLLSPARRPMQVTRDLASFWKNGYQLVRKELRGRYPKHRWPEDPVEPDA